MELTYKCSFDSSWKISPFPTVNLPSALPAMNMEILGLLTLLISLAQAQSLEDIRGEADDENDVFAYEGRFKREANPAVYRQSTLYIEPSPSYNQQQIYRDDDVRVVGRTPVQRVAAKAGTAAYVGAKAGSGDDHRHPVAVAAGTGAYLGAKAGSSHHLGRREASPEAPPRTTTHCNGYGYCYTTPNYYRPRPVTRVATAAGAAAYAGARAGSRYPGPYYRGKRAASAEPHHTTTYCNGGYCYTTSAHHTGAKPATKVATAAYIGARAGSNAGPVRPVAVAAGTGAYLGAKAGSSHHVGKREASPEAPPRTTTYCNGYGYCYTTPNYYYPPRRPVVRTAAAAGTAAYIGAKAGSRRGKREARVTYCNNGYCYSRPSYYRPYYPRPYYYRPRPAAVATAAYVGARAGARRG